MKHTITKCVYDAAGYVCDTTSVFEREPWTTEDTWILAVMLAIIVGLFVAIYYCTKR